MFLFAPIPWYSWVAWFVVLGALIGLNEVTRRWKWAGLAFFVAVPVILTLFVWPITAGEFRDASSYQTTRLKYFSSSSTVATVLPL